MKVSSRIFYTVSICILFSVQGTALDAEQKIILDRVSPIEQSATLPDTARDIQRVLRDPAQIRVPESYGSIKEIWIPGARVIGRDCPLIIHIQDAHCNYEAQTNISQVLDGLMKEYPGQIELVAVEGSVGIIDTGPFAEFSDAQIRHEVADYFMKKGKITGPEFLSIIGSHKFTIYGIENRELYDKNYKAFLASLPFRTESGKYCGHLAGILSRLKHYIYSAELKEFDRYLKGYQDGDTTFLDYAGILKKRADIQGVGLEKFRNFSILLQAQHAEGGIDFDVVDKERAGLIDRLGKTLDKQELSTLVLKSLHFRLGKLNASEYYNYLERLVQETSGTGKVSRKDYPNLLSYIDYVQLHERMDKARLFQECSQIEKLIAQDMFKNDNQRKLFQLSRHLDILRRMFKLELVKEDYLAYKLHKAEFRVAVFLSFIKVQAPRYGITFYEEPGLSKIDENLPLIEEFYETAITRDPVLIDNMLAEMEKQGVNICVLISGGFHTRGLTSILRERDLAYVIISPKITRKQEYNPYIDIMTNKKTPFEEFLEQLELK